jgi:GTP-binding protein
MKFVDQVRAYIKAGDGGDGCCSFRREKYLPKGGPDGGNGGKGGDVILEADKDTSSLVALYYQPIVKAKNGAHGQGNDKVGRSAPDLILRVPVGTLVYPLEPPPVHDPADFSTLNEDDEHAAPEHKKGKIDPRKLTPLFDLNEPGQRVVLCKGGEGGRGNASFKSSTNRAPRQFTKGNPGEEGWFLFELRSIAFAGLVGYPNAGKSTLLNAISAAHPKIAAYPFTTLHPHIGVVELGAFDRTTVADIPGLIEGAHENRGLGHEFLRHIMRCKHLLFVLDMGGSDGRDPISDLQSLRTELDLYDPLLSQKPWSIIANKMDLPGAADHLKTLERRFSKIPILPVAIGVGQGADAVKAHLAALVQASV